MMTMRNTSRWLILPIVALTLAACSRQPEPGEQAAMSAKEQKAAQEAQAKAQEAQLASRWNSLSGEIPQIVDVVTARVGLLEKKHELPQGVDAGEFKDVKEAATTMTQSWQEALGAFANSNMPEAVAAAQRARDKGSEVMQTLRMAPAS